MNVLKPALHTLWQSFLAAIVVWWSASGLVGVRAVRNVDDAKRFAMSAVLAALAALMSALFHTIRQYAPALLSRLGRPRLDPAQITAVNRLLDEAFDVATPAVSELGLQTEPTTAGLPTTGAPSS
jgi:hypothetical protein